MTEAELTASTPDAALQRITTALQHIIEGDQGWNFAGDRPLEDIAREVLLTDIPALVAEVRKLRAERTLLVKLALNVSVARTKAEVQRVMTEHRKAVAALQEEVPHD